MPIPLESITSQRLIPRSFLIYFHTAICAGTNNSRSVPFATENRDLGCLFSAWFIIKVYGLALVQTKFFFFSVCKIKNVRREWKLARQARTKYTHKHAHTHTHTHAHTHTHTRAREQARTHTHTHCLSHTQCVSVCACACVCTCVYVRV